MADHDWTPDDDARLRAALTSLRADTEAAPLPDVRFVKARGMARRRQRLLTLTAAAAAAVVVAGTVGYTQLGHGGDVVHLPAARTSTSGVPTTPATTAAADSLDQPGALPLLLEWTSALDLTGTVQLNPVKPFGPIECLASEPGTKVQQEQVTRTPDLEGGQVRFRIAKGQDPRTAAEGIASDIAGCQLQPAYHVTPESSGGFPRLFSYTAGDAGSGWWAVVPGPHDVVVLQVNQNDRPTSSITHPQLTKLADLAEKRLARYGSGAPTPSATTTIPSGPKAVNEKMPVSGADPLPSSDLFVAASQWTSKQFASGARAYAGKAGASADLGGIGVFCETDAYLSGVGGQFGVVEVRAGSGDANVIGHQRVRVDQSADPTQAADARAAQIRDEEVLLAKGCTEPDGRVSVTMGESVGTYLLAKKVAGGTAYRWVGVTALSTPGAWTTVVFHGTSDGQGFQGTAAEGFTELDRLLALARQK